MENDNLQIDLPGEEVATFPSDDQPETAWALMSQLEIEALHSSGPMVNRVTGKKDIFVVVSFFLCLICDFFNLPSLYRFSGRIVWLGAKTSS